jgi:hypothetical protein
MVDKVVWVETVVMLRQVLELEDQEQQVALQVLVEIVMQEDLLVTT